MLIVKTSSYDLGFSFGIVNFGCNSLAIIMQYYDRCKCLSLFKFDLEIDKFFYI